MKARNLRVDNLIQTAEKHIGVRSRAQRNTDFGAALGRNGMAWNGSFLEIVVRESGERGLPSLADTTAALAEFIKRNQLHQKPKRGDIVFYSFSQDTLGQPHIGLVTDASLWRSHGKFTAIEGMTASGLPNGGTEADGVYERTRYTTDVLGFARPTYGKSRKSESTDSENAPFIQLANVQPGKTTKSILYVQQALHATVGLRGAESKKFDRQTRSAVARYQRLIGMRSDDGVPNEPTLARLAADTDNKFFRFKA